ncbi:MAG: signal peptide peptidase SppA [Polyangiaceae bacterium]
MTSPRSRSPKAARWLGGALALALACTAAAACEGRAPQGSTAENKPAPEAEPLGGPAVIELDLRGGVAETADTGLFGGGRRSTFTELVDTLHELRDADTTQGMFVRFGAGRIGFARAHEIGRALASLREKNKPVVCHADDYDNAAYLAASLGCSSVWVSPAGGVDTVGIAAQLLFAKSFLARYKVDVDYLQIGKYKGAEEPFTRDAPSPEARSSLETALTGIRTAWLDAIAKGRKDKLPGGVVEDGPFSPEEAKAKGLVDEIGYLDDALAAVKKAASTTRIRKRFGGREEPSFGRGLADMFRGMSGSGGTPHVAVLPASGAISMSGGGGLPLGGDSGITERALSRELTKLTKDEATKAVVLRIDSPGGSALASDLLWSKLMKLRAEKPLVVSVGGMAASGGYYLSCAATKIVAEPTSIVGSIGVVGGKLSFGRALDEYGIHAETVAAAPEPEKAARSSYMSLFSPWDDRTRDKVRASMQAIYDLFLKRVSEGRDLPVEKVQTFAEGRLFAGEQAKSLGMVDEVGGLEDAIHLAMELAKLPADTPVDLVGTPPTLFEALANEDAVQGDSSAREAAARTARDALAAPGAFPALPPAWSEQVPELHAFAAAFTPLLAGERVLAVTPFALAVR